MPTAIWKSQLESGLRGGEGGLRSGSRGWDLDCEEEEEAEEMEKEEAEEENSSDKI